MAPPIFNKDLYVIFSALDSNRGITWIFVPDLPIEGPNPTIVEVRGLISTSQPKWRFVPGPEDSNLYTITLAGQDKYHAIVKDGLFWLTTEGDPTEFSIESEGNDQWRFHIPNKNEVLGLDEAGNQISTGPQDGSANKR